MRWHHFGNKEELAFAILITSAYLKCIEGISNREIT